jgi:hypothetical protein
MSYAFLLAGFLATTNAGRVAVAVQACRPGPRAFAAALLVGAAIVIAGAVAANPLLDALSISPESFRIAAGLVLAAAAVRTIVGPGAWSGPFVAVLLTPELTAVALSFGADEPTLKVLSAAAPALLPALLAHRARRAATGALTAQFLAALQIVVAVALAVAGIRDV